LVSTEEIEAFLLGKSLPEEAVREIDRALDDPESEVSRLSREYSRVARLMFDPEGPLLGELGIEGEGVEKEE
jgi:hypothetical protein